MQHHENAVNRPPVHSDALRLRLSSDLRNGITLAASKRNMSVSAWIRNAALTTMMLEGIDTIVTFEGALDTAQVSAAGNLYLTELE